jgi:hypothetical protein
MDIRPKYELKTLTKRLAIGSGLSMVNAAAGIFKIDKQVIDIPAGVYAYDIEITVAGGDVKTYVRGEWEILQDVTYG